MEVEGECAGVGLGCWRLTENEGRRCQDSEYLGTHGGLQIAPPHYFVTRGTPGSGKYNADWETLYLFQRTKPTRHPIFIHIECSPFISVLLI